MAFAQGPGSREWQNAGPGDVRGGLGFGTGGAPPPALSASPERGNLRRLGAMATNYRQGPLATALAAAEPIAARQRMNQALGGPGRGLAAALAQGGGTGMGPAAAGMQRAFGLEDAMRSGEQSALGDLFRTASAFEQPEIANVDRMVGLRDSLYGREKGRFDAWLKKKQSDALARAAASSGRRRGLFGALGF